METQGTSLKKGIVASRQRPPHTAAHTVDKIRALKCEVLKYPPCSPHLATSDFHLKEYLQGQKFADDNEVVVAVQRWLKAMPKIFFFYRKSTSLWTGGPSVLRSRGTTLKNKTQTISIFTLIKELL
jgi:hypothetical protein